MLLVHKELEILAQLETPVLLGQPELPVHKEPEILAQLETQVLLELMV